MLEEGLVLRTRFYTGYLSEGYVYERRLWLTGGLVFPDIHTAMFTRPRQEGLEPDAEVDGIPLYYPAKGLNMELPDDPCHWFPVCIDQPDWYGWGYAHTETGELAYAPWGGFTFCDHFYEGCARYSFCGRFDPERQDAYGTGWTLIDQNYNRLLEDFDYLSCVQDGVVLAQQEGRWGAFKKTYPYEAYKPAKGASKEEWAAFFNAPVLDLEEPGPDATELEWDEYLTRPLFSFQPLLPLDWDGMTFAKSTLVAKKDTPHGPRYALFDGYEDKGNLVLDGLTEVTVPDKPREDGLPFNCRLVQKDGRWGILDGPHCTILCPPTLDREAAETRFWEEELEWD